MDVFKHVRHAPVVILNMLIDMKTKVNPSTPCFEAALLLLILAVLLPFFSKKESFEAAHMTHHLFIPDYLR